MSIPQDCKRLIEVDFPIAAVSVQSAREKSIRHGHPSTLHLWWARRPLAACRAVLIGLLLPDPADPHCPNSFKVEARRLMSGIEGEGPKSDLDLRQRLLDFIAEFSDWDNSTGEYYLSRARALVTAAHSEETPLVVDPFAGGGSIPLEALRVGCEAFASDLNPVACLILRAMLEDIPRRGPKFAVDLRRVGAEIKAAAEKEVAEFYPPDLDGARPIAYIWARTVRCESPNCGAEIPLARSFWLCKKVGRKYALRYKIGRAKEGPPLIEFEVFTPKRDSEVPKGTVSQAKATCPSCAATTPPERVRAQLAAQHGGADVIFEDKGRRIGGSRLLAVVCLKGGEQGRRYRTSTERDYQCVWNAAKLLKGVSREKLSNGLSKVPDEVLPTPLGKKFQQGDPYYNFLPVLNYGITSWGDLFTVRQKIAIVCLQKTLRMLLAKEDSRDLTLLVSCLLSRCVDYWSVRSLWVNLGEFVSGTAGRHAIPPLWDFAEVNPFGDGSGSYDGAVDWIARVIEQSFEAKSVAQVQLADARDSLLPDATASVWFTDPPYYDQVPYAALSDFFYVWLKRLLLDSPLMRDPNDSANPLTPKSQEIVESLEWLRGVPKDKAKKMGIMVKDREDYADGMTQAFSTGRRILREDGVGCVVFAHQTTEGWEALLSGLIRGGWVITGSWPVATERPGRLRSQASAALATSVHLVCRARDENADVGEWESVLHELPQRVGAWMERLQTEGIRGADLVFSCIGPAMELYSRHPRVETADGREVKLDEFLAKVWEVLGLTALQRVLGGQEKTGETTGALEEDARLTALFLWALQSTTMAGNGEPQTGVDKPVQEVVDEDDDEGIAKGPVRGGYSLPFDIVRRFAQPLGIHLRDWDGRVIETEKGVVRLLPISARAGRLFGGETTEAVAAGADHLRRGQVQATLFPGLEPRQGTREDDSRPKKPMRIATTREMTTLDRLHSAMLLQTAGQSGALIEFLGDEIRRGPQFLRLANALSALYPKKSEEKRLLDAVLLAMPRR